MDFTNWSIPRPAVELIKRWEGLHDLRDDGLVYPYLCPAGVPTIGYGTVIDSLDHPPITPERAEQLLMADLPRRLMGVYRLCPVLFLHPGERRDAAVLSFAYNLGLGNLKASTLRECINAREWEAAGDEFHKWVWAGGRKLAGLIARRADEARIFRGGKLND